MKFIKILVLLCLLSGLLTINHWRWWGADNNDFTTEVLGSWVFGNHELSLSDASLVVRHLDSQKTLFNNRYGERLIHISDSSLALAEHRGMALTDVDLTWGKCLQVISQVEAGSDAEHRLVLHGDLVCDDTSMAFELHFDSSGNTLDITLTTDSTKQLALHSFLEPSVPAVGFGAQFSRVNMRGLLVPIVVSEQGIGRGREPLTTMVDWVAGAGGDWSTTYAPIPWFFTNDGRGYWLESDSPSWFDFRTSDRMVVTSFGNALKLRIYNESSPRELISQFTADTGRMSAPPKWVDKGLIAGLQGGESTWSKLTQLEKAEIPIAGVWLQDWVGQRTTSFGKQLWWNWRLDQAHYPNWDEQVEALAARDIRVLGYLNPFLVPDERQVSASPDLWDLALAKGILLEASDGSPVEFPNTSFWAGMIRLDNPDLNTWYRDMLRQRMQGLGFSGWMADFAEAYPGHQSDGYSEHNAYPVEWSKFNADLVSDLALEDALVWHRSAYTGSSEVTSAFWLGDQMVTWDEHDGLKSAVTGLLTASMSGLSVNHSDIGGYTTIDHPLVTYRRSPELLLRWLELNAFGLILRSHEGNIPSLNAQLYDESLVDEVADLVNVFVALAPYRRDLYHEMEATGVPPIRHPLVEYPNVDRFWSLRYMQYFLGSEILVAPVTSEGSLRARAILPVGEWLHLWTGEVYTGHQEGNEVVVPAPIGKPGVFIRLGSPVLDLLSDITDVE